MRYLDVLETAWREHLKAKPSDAPTVVSLFAGCGGSSLGYSMAGFRELLAIEWEANACETFRLNFPAVPLWQGDIAKLEVSEALRLAGLEVGELDVLDGSPPCQGFSTAGKRLLDDPRNSLFREYVRLLRAFMPRALVMENVSGMVKGKMKLLFAQAIRELKASGYRVSCRLMDAAYFNVPQHRQRVVYIGIREDLGIESSHPKAERLPFILREALVGVVNSEADIADSRYPEISVCHRLLKQMRPWEGGHLYHPKGAMFGLRRLAWDRACRTVLKEDGGGASCQCCHPDDDRRLTIPELKRVSSFPDGFRLVGKTGEQWARIGNSVPSLFMRAIAGHLGGLLENAYDKREPTDSGGVD